MIFITKNEVLTIHKRAIEEFGGDPGILNEGALESAIIAVENRLHYEGSDLATLAATYAYHINKAHAFMDGNKRTAATVMKVFIIANDANINASVDQLEALFLGIAAGNITRDQTEEKIRQWIT